ncbi:MAG: DM13 domain-containing protein [Anaerolineae bacterium]|nr:DM13 domain-containing protein [Anaerolineae bacterium]
MKGPRWGILLLGALIVVLLFTFPLWRTVLRSGSSQRAFADASEAQREVLLKEKDRNLAATAYVSLLVTVQAPTPTGAPTALAQDAILGGRFTEIDAVHRATGRARLYRMTNQSVILQLEDGFSVTNAPNLTLYLCGTEKPATIADLEVQGASPFEVGDLLGSSGEQRFTIPGQLPLERYKSVVIVSKSLARIYSYAVLQ